MTVLIFIQKMICWQDRVFLRVHLIDFLQTSVYMDIYVKDIVHTCKYFYSDIYAYFFTNTSRFSSGTKSCESSRNISMYSSVISLCSNEIVCKSILLYVYLYECFFCAYFRFET